MQPLIEAVCIIQVARGIHTFDVLHSAALKHAFYLRDHVLNYSIGSFQMCSEHTFGVCVLTGFVSLLLPSCVI